MSTDHKFHVQFTDPGLSRAIIYADSVPEILAALPVYMSAGYTRAAISEHLAGRYVAVQILTREPSYEDIRREWFVCRPDGPPIGDLVGIDLVRSD